MRYAILSRLLAPLALFALWWRGRSEPAWREGLGERRGRVARRQDRPLWVHAASVGEANSAAGFFRQLLQQHPELPLHLTAFTPTGLARLRELVPGARHSYLPIDSPAAMRRFVNAVRPRAAVVLETECWPNMLAQCARQSVPVIWLSGRLSERSVRRLPTLFGAGRLRKALGQVKAFGVQTARDSRRFATLGAPADRLHTTGSLKFDLELPADLSHRAKELRDGWGRELVWLAASTHPGEEEQVLQAHARLLESRPDALLLLAPRHPRRTAEVEALIESAGLDRVTRSEGAQLGQAQVLLIDTLGELMLFYAACDICLVAGSLQPIGGHNLLEPAALSRPIISGPHLDSCRDVADTLIGLQALTIVDDATALAEALESFAADRLPWWERGDAAASFARANRGAVERSLALLEPWLDGVSRLTG